MTGKSDGNRNASGHGGSGNFRLPGFDSPHLHNPSGDLCTGRGQTDAVPADAVERSAHGVLATLGFRPARRKAVQPEATQPQLLAEQWGVWDGHTRPRPTLVHHNHHKKESKA